MFIVGQHTNLSYNINFYFLENHKNIFERLIWFREYFILF